MRLGAVHTISAPPPVKHSPKRSSKNHKDRAAEAAFVDELIRSSCAQTGSNEARAHLEARLLCFRRFISPSNLAKGVLRALSSSLKSRNIVVARGALAVLNTWLNLRSDTRALETDARLLKYLQRARSLGEVIGEDVSRVNLTLLRALARRHASRHPHLSATNSSRALPVAPLVSSLSPRPPTTPAPRPQLERLWSNTREDIAAMLSRVHWELYSQIPVQEFLALACGHKDHRSATLRAFIERFSRMSEWVACCILAQTELSAQTRLYAYFVYIAQLLAQAGNYDACSAVIAGCTLHEIDRLKRVWKVPEKVDLLFRYTRANVDPNANFKSYRNLLSQRLKNETQPFVPLIACHLRDITLIEEGNPDRGPDDAINESKISQLYATLSMIIAGQRRDLYRPPPTLTEQRAASLRRHMEVLRSRGKKWLEERSQQIRPSAQSSDTSDSSVGASVVEDASAGMLSSDGSHRSHDSDLVDIMEDV